MVVISCKNKETDDRGNPIEPGDRIPIDHRGKQKIDIEMFAQPSRFNQKTDGRGLKRGPGKGRPRKHGLVGSTKYDNGITNAGSNEDLPNGLPLSNRLLEFMQSLG